MSTQQRAFYKCINMFTPFCIMYSKNTIARNFKTLQLSHFWFSLENISFEPIYWRLSFQFLNYYNFNLGKNMYNFFNQYKIPKFTEENTESSTLIPKMLRLHHYSRKISGRCPCSGLSRAQIRGNHPPLRCPTPPPGFSPPPPPTMTLVGLTKNWFK